MRKFRAYLLAAAGLVVLVSVIGAIGPKRALAAIGFTPVRDVNDGALQPTQFNLFATLGSPATFLVPPGKRLVIEYVNVTGDTVAGAVCDLTTTSGGSTGIYRLYMSTAGGGFTSKDLTRIYADPGTGVTLTLYAPPTVPGFNVAGAWISGHYVNLP